MHSPLPLLVISWLFEKGQIQALSHMTWTAFGAVLYTGLISTILAFAIWGNLFKKYSPNIVAPFSLLVPIFGLLSSFVLLNESLTAVELASSCLVFTGLSCIVFGSKLSALLKTRVRWFERR